MAREGDLPRPLAAVHERYRVPHRAEVALAVVVVGLVLTVDLRGAIGFSSFGVLLYYLVANAAALTQDRAHRRFPRALQVLGAVGCVALAATLPVASVVGGVVVVAAGLAWRAVVVAVARRRVGGSA
jgi:APA family basic amino acid/polyamine antiporter